MTLPQVIKHLASLTFSNPYPLASLKMNLFFNSSLTNSKFRQYDTLYFLSIKASSLSHKKVLLLFNSSGNSFFVPLNEICLKRLLYFF